LEKVYFYLAGLPTMYKQSNEKRLKPTTVLNYQLGFGKLGGGK